MRRTFVRCALLLMCCFLPTVVTAAELRGSVVDQAGRPVVGAKVTIEGSIISRAKVAISGKAGEFYFWGLPPGDYSVTVTVQDSSQKPARTPIRIDEGSNTRKLTVSPP